MLVEIAELEPIEALRARVLGVGILGEAQQPRPVESRPLQDVDLGREAVELVEEHEGVRGEQDGHAMLTAPAMHASKKRLNRVGVEAVLGLLDGKERSVFGAGEVT